MAIGKGAIPANAGLEITSCLGQFFRRWISFDLCFSKSRGFLTIDARSFSSIVEISGKPESTVLFYLG
ncbi:hypothetical protein NST12_01420 [Bacillus sp. FSL W8-1127]|jgi:hypothetical protein|uniref:hypothetical protein n=1 Tax=Bacillus TaxID=1386 RepID=UPI002E2111DF|nr:hypothetical protein [Bacillus smithii]MED4928485.1 hypothetical protein [Bacillus smithii]